MQLVPFEKLAATDVTDEDAASSLRRLKRIERSAPTGEQIGRYAALGAGLGVGSNAIKEFIAKGSKDVMGGKGRRLRGMAGAAVSGALMAGGAPLIRSHFDRQAEIGTLQRYLKQPTAPPQVVPTPPAIAQPTAHKLASLVPAAEVFAEHELRKLSAGAPTRGGFLMASEVPSFQAPNLRTVTQLKPAEIKSASIATTPAGRLSSARRVGLPKVTAPPGPAIADTVPTFGARAPGASKTTIGKKPAKMIPTMDQAPAQI